MKSKFYYPYLDLLKFICCIGVVTIHTKPYFYWPDPAKEIMAINLLCVPIFFIISAYLLAKKLDGSNDWIVLRKFVARLCVLYILYTVLMSPEWFPGFIKHNPDNWLALLPLKLLIVGAPHGSWFVLGLIYGSLIVYVFNRYLGKLAASILLFVFFVYLIFSANGIIPDVLHFSVINKVVRYNLSPLWGLFFIQIGFLFQWNNLLVRLKFYLTKKINGGGKILIILMSLCFAVVMPADIRPVANIIPEILIIAVCSSLFDKNMEKYKDFTTLRKMSIIIYFLHFAFVTGFRFLNEHGMIDFMLGLRVFFITAIACSLISYIIVRLSEKYRLLKYLF